MLRVSQAYKTWASQMFPPKSSAEVLEKCREWSGRHLVKSVLGVMRTAEEEREAKGPLTEQAYNELTEGARRAAEAETSRKRERLGGGRGAVNLDGDSVGSAMDGEGCEGEAAAEEEDFTERNRRERGEEDYVAEEEDAWGETLRRAGGGGGGAGGGGGSEVADFGDVNAAEANAANAAEEAELAQFGSQTQLHSQSQGGLHLGED